MTKTLVGKLDGSIIVPLKESEQIAICGLPMPGDIVEENGAVYAYGMYGRVNVTDEFSELMGWKEPQPITEEDVL